MLVFKFFIFIFFFSTTSFATIYGTNTLKDVQSHPSAFIHEVSDSVAVLMKNYHLDDKNPYQYRTLLDAWVCESEPFVEQPRRGLCTGFLISPQHILTASHCYAGFDNMCETAKWVFDYKKTTPDSFHTLLKPSRENIYGCEEIVDSSYAKNLDYMIVKLDRPVKDRLPLPVKRQGLTSKDIEENVFTISSPRGLPLKFSEGKIRDIKKNFFITNLDTMKGSSGAPVFNSQGQVLGVLASGDKDFESQDEPFCNRYKRCEKEGCRGEYATKTSEIPQIDFLKQNSPQLAY